MSGERTEDVCRDQEWSWQRPRRHNLGRLCKLRAKDSLRSTSSTGVCRCRGGMCSVCQPEHDALVAEVRSRQTLYSDAATPAWATLLHRDMSVDVELQSTSGRRHGAHWLALASHSNHLRKVKQMETAPKEAHDEEATASPSFGVSLLNVSGSDEAIQEVLHWIYEGRFSSPCTPRRSIFREIYDIAYTWEMNDLLATLETSLMDGTRVAVSTLLTLLAWSLVHLHERLAIKLSLCLNRRLPKDPRALLAIVRGVQAKWDSQENGPFPTSHLYAIVAAFGCTAVLLDPKDRSLPPPTKRGSESATPKRHTSGTARCTDCHQSLELCARRGKCAYQWIGIVAFLKEILPPGRQVCPALCLTAKECVERWKAAPGWYPWSLCQEFWVRMALREFEEHPLGDSSYSVEGSEVSTEGSQWPLSPTVDLLSRQWEFGDYLGDIFVYDGEGKRHSAYRAVLTSRCPLLLERSGGGNEIHLSPASTKAVDLFLQWLHSRSPRLPTTVCPVDLKHLYTLSSEYQVNDLLKDVNAVSSHVLTTDDLSLEERMDLLQWALEFPPSSSTLLLLVIESLQKVDKNKFFEYEPPTRATQTSVVSLCVLIALIAAKHNPLPHTSTDKPPPPALSIRQQRNKSPHSKQRRLLSSSSATPAPPLYPSYSTRRSTQFTTSRESTQRNSPNGRLQAEEEETPSTPPLPLSQSPVKPLQPENKNPKVPPLPLSQSPVKPLQQENKNPKVPPLPLSQSPVKPLPPQQESISPASQMIAMDGSSVRQRVHLRQSASSASSLTNFSSAGRVSLKNATNLEEGKKHVDVLEGKKHVDVLVS